MVRGRMTDGGIKMIKVFLLTATAAVALLPAAASAQINGYPGLYSEFRVGGSFLSDARNTGSDPTVGINIESEFDTGFVGEVAIGREEPFGLRYEVALGYAKFGVGDLTVIEDGGIGVDAGVGDLDGLSVTGDGYVDAFTYMLNGYYAFGVGDVRPYVGAGVGGAYVSADISALGAKVANNGEHVLAYQGTAGAEYRLSSNIVVGARYTYFATSDPTFRDALGVKFDSEVQSHSAMLTIRFVSE